MPMYVSMCTKIYTNNVVHHITVELRFWFGREKKNLWHFSLNIDLVEFCYDLCVCNHLKLFVRIWNAVRQRKRIKIWTTRFLWLKLRDKHFVHMCAHAVFSHANLTFTLKFWNQNSLCENLHAWTYIRMDFFCFVIVLFVRCR